MSQRHALIWETAMRAQPLRFLFGARAYIRNFRWTPEGGSALHAVSLDDGDAATVIGIVDARSMVCEATLHAPQVVPFGFRTAFAV